MTRSQIVPASEDAELARVAVRAINSHLKGATRHEPQSPIKLTVEGDSSEIVVPGSVLELLSQILANLANGHGVTLVPTHAELTTQQAAEILNVSRPYLIGLLDAGEIEYRLVGTHRRVSAGSLLEYQRRDRDLRREAADELSAQSQEFGLI